MGHCSAKHRGCVNSKVKFVTSMPVEPGSNEWSIHRGESRRVDRKEECRRSGRRQVGGGLGSSWEAVMPKEGVACVAARGGGIENSGEKKIARYADDGKGFSLKIQYTDAKKALASVRKMDVGANVVVLGGGRSYTRRTRRCARARWQSTKIGSAFWAHACRRGEITPSLSQFFSV